MDHLLEQERYIENWWKGGGKEENEKVSPDDLYKSYCEYVTMHCSMAGPLKKHKFRAFVRRQTKSD